MPGKTNLAKNLNHITTQKDNSHIKLYVFKYMKEEWALETLHAQATDKGMKNTSINPLISYMNCFIKATYRRMVLSVQRFYKKVKLLHIYISQ